VRGYVGFVDIVKQLGMLGEDRLGKAASLRSGINAVTRGGLVEKLMDRNIEAVRGNKCAGTSWCIEFGHGISLSVEFFICEIPHPGEAA
jgi:hypothetical protein